MATPPVELAAHRTHWRSMHTDYNRHRNLEIRIVLPMSRPAAWSFLTNHAQVLLCIARDPGVRLRDIGAAVGITERAALRIVGELEAAGYVTRRRVGRRSRYTIRAELPLPDPAVRNQRVGDLLAVLAGDVPPGLWEEAATR
jgi:MarR family